MTTERKSKNRVVLEALGNLRRRFGGLELIGSWATSEAHIPQSCGRYGWSTSLSDVDLVYDGPTIPSLISKARESIEEACDDARITIKGVSVRGMTDISGMPQSLLGHWIKPNEQMAVNFLCFWTAVSVTGVMCLQQSRETELPVRLYSAAKFFFTFARNVALLRGVELRSYRDITRWSVETVGIANVDLALDIKTGRAVDMDIYPIVSLLSGGIDSLLGWAHIPLVDQIGLIREDMMSLLTQGISLDRERYFGMAQSSAYDPALTRVIAHQYAKCNKSA